MTSIYEFYLQALFGWDENRKDRKGGRGKQGRKYYFSLFGLGEKTRGKENNEEKNHSRPTNIQGLFGKVF